MLRRTRGEREDEWKNQERERGFVVCAVNSQTWGGALVRPALSDFVKSRPHNGQCTHIQLIPLSQILSEPSPLTHTKSDPSIPPRVAYRRNARTTIINQPQQHVNPQSPNLSYHTNVPPHNIHRSLSFISPPRLSVVQLSSSSFIRFPPPSLPFFILPPHPSL